MQRRTLCVVLLSFLVACGTPPPDGDELPPPFAGDAGKEDAPVTPPPPPLPDVEGLRIASWNIEQFPKQEGTIDAVRALVEEHQLDLVGIQEITDPEAFEALADSLPDHEMFVSFDSWAFTRVGFLYRPDRIEVGEVDRLFRRESYAFPRDPLMAEIAVKNDAGEVVFDFTFVVVHLKARLDEESRQRRIAAMIELDEWIRARMEIDPDVVVVGDFNDELTDPPEWNVFGPFLHAPETYSFLTLPEEEAGAHSYITFTAMIDHILVTNDALGEYGEGVTQVLSIDDTMSDYQRMVSDHRPVVATFALP